MANSVNYVLDKRNDSCEKVYGDVVERKSEMSFRELSGKIREADDAVCELYNIENTIAYLQENRNNRVLRTRRQKTVLGLLIAGTVLSWLVMLAAPAMVVVNLGLCIAAIVFHFKFKNANRRAADAMVDELFIRKYEIENDSREAIEIIPQRYRFPVATGLIRRCFDENRVSSLNEALDKVDEELNALRVQNTYEQLLYQYEQQRKAETASSVAGGIAAGIAGLALGAFFSGYNSN